MAARTEYALPAGFDEIQLDKNLALTWGDREVFARAISRNTGASVVAIEDAITQMSMRDTIRGSSTVEIELIDQDWMLVDYGYFDASKDGKLDAIDVNWPDGSKVWWRLSQLGIDDNGGGCRLRLSFMERGAAHLLSHQGPKKTSRNKKTRAQFLAGLANEVKASPITFISKELTKKQQVESKTADEQKRDKDPGISGGATLTVKGASMSASQRQIAERILAVANQLGAGDKPTLAMMEAAIIENELSNSGVINDPGSTSVGVFQAQYGLSAGVKGTMTREQCLDVEYCAESFLKDPGFASKGGAISLAKAHPDWTAGQIAQRVEMSAFPDRYDQVEDEAKKIIEAGGGVSDGGGTYTQQYNFEVGSSENPRETYWDAMQRLAEEVHWCLFFDGPYLYFDSETTLIRQKPAVTFKRGDAAIVKFNCNWDSRQVATECNIDVLANPFELRAGEVVALEDFGPASTGSTAKLPGRWLIEEIDYPLFQPIMSLRLKQPEKPKKEPRSEEAQRSGGADPAGGAVTGMTPKEIVDTYVVPLAVENKMATGITAEMVQQANARHGATTSGNVSDHQGPPSRAWAADMSNGSSPTKEMDKLAADIATTFDIPWSGSGAVSKSANGFRYQLIYRSDVGGNHYNHVHFGVQAADPGVAGYTKGPGRPD